MAPVLSPSPYSRYSGATGCTFAHAQVRGAHDFAFDGSIQTRGDSGTSTECGVANV